MRCMAGTNRGTRCRREGAKTGDMRRYCVQHGRQMCLTINRDAITDLLYKHGFQGPYRVGKYLTWSNFDLDARILANPKRLETMTEEQAKELASHEWASIQYELTKNTREGC